MAKWAVWALSPISTTWLLPLKWLHFSQISRLKFSHAEPRKWREFVISLWPSSVSENSFSQNSID